LELRNVMNENSGLRPGTRVAHGGHDAGSTGDVAPILRPSTNFARDPSYRLIADKYGYSRDGNPTYSEPEALLANLEGGAGALLFASGMAAATAVIMALKPGDRIAAPTAMYWGLRDWLIEFCGQWGLGLDLYDVADPGALNGTLRPGETKLLWIETPANPTWEVMDIAACAAAAKAAGARLAVDSTVPTPILTRPLVHGADLVFHSATKYLNGHGDVVAGALVTARADEFWTRIRGIRAHGGAVLGPFESWLLQRGLRTLHLRVRQASANALAIASHFEGHQKLRAVLYPGLASHPGHAIAARQMQGGFGGMLSLRVRGGAQEALAVAAHLRLFVRATSLGGVESLVEHRASVEGAASPVPPDLLRLSVGIEEPEDLIADLEQALAAL
jgi:cystathionine gamma-synthase